MSMTLLELMEQTTAELGINQPSQIVGSTDPQIIQLFALLNRLGKDLCRQFDWQRLNKEHILTTVSYSLSGTLTEGSPVITGISSTSNLTTQFGVGGTGVVAFAQIESVDSATQVTMNMDATESGTYTLDFAQVYYSLPSDWKKQIPQTEWDRTNRWPLMGPQSPQSWQSFKSGIVYAGPRERFRILHQAIAVNPLPPDGLQFAFEYISNAWVRSSAGAEQDGFLADTDTSIFDDSLLITGLKAKWKAAKGLDGAFDLAEFQGMLEQCKAQDKSAPKLSLSPVGATILLTQYNVQDSNFPGN